MNTDITDCYGSIYTHTITWSLHGKCRVKKEILEGNRKKEIGDYIDLTIECMQYAQTNGIPQGSVLMDFIAEMVLGYADRILFYKIKNTTIKKKIIKLKIIKY